ncbi:MAG: hypothetical protein AB8G96_08470 [Phycisphaerales bacterium]
MSYSLPVAAAAAFSFILTSATMAEEEHADVWILPVDGALTTGSISEDGDPISMSERVFAADFGEDPSFPFASIEPGFQMNDGALDAFAAMSFSIDGAVTRWDGNGFSSAAEVMSLSFGPASVTSGDGPVSGFGWTADDEGGFHDHFDIELMGDGGDPTNGVYLLPLSLSAEMSGEMLSSDTFWFVLNLGEDEAAHDAAIDWVQLNLVPGPFTGALFLLAGARSRRRRRSN